MEGGAPNQASTPTGAVFLSYASQDAEAASRICDALLAGGIEVWLDQSELRGGDAWDRKIRDQIRHCALFIPIISVHSQARLEGYFRREWKLAVERTQDLADEIAFLVPVVIDDTPERGASVPERFHEVQWTRLAAGVPSQEFVRLISRLLSHPQDRPAVHTFQPGPTALARSRAVSKSGWQWRMWPLPAAAAILVTGGYIGIDRYVLHKGIAPSAASFPPGKAYKSIAVLPFTDLSEKRDQEYFADGMAEEIINLLTKIPDLKVIGRTSSFQFKAKADDLRKIGTTLGAAYVVEGSVRRSGDLVRVTAQLIDTRDGTPRWAETYDREFGGVLKVQDEVALGLVRALQVEVASTVFVGSQSAPPTADAYDSYLRGIHARDRFDQRGLEEAVAHFRHTLQLAPSFAPAAEALASTLYFMTESTYLPPESGFNQARAAAEAALKLDPRSSGAHAVICLVNTVYDWNWSAAAHECAIAAQISPNKSLVLQAAAVQHMALGDWKDATSSIETAIANDPLDAALYNIAARIYVRAGRVKEAETAVRRALQISPTSAFNHHLLGVTLLLQGRATEALVEMQQEGSGPGAQAVGLALAYHALHRERDADAAIARLKAEHGDDAALLVAEAYAYRSQKDAAFEWLDRSFAQRDNSLYTLKGAPLFKSLEGDARYTAFLRKMNLPE
jgi:TolB-like protein/Flp pilus assembly protein TadD